MSNMSYCRFENTYHDLADCVNALAAGERISEDEMWYASTMRRLCERFIEEFDDYEPEEEE